MNDLIDTIINIETILFIGLLFWLYFKDFDQADDPNETRDKDNQ